MTADLARLVRTMTIDATEGVTARALRDVLADMAVLAKSDGTMRYGYSASKAAQRTGYSERTVKRARAALEAAGLIHRERTGGGRSATLWTVTLGVTAAMPDSHSTPDTPAQQPCPPGTAQEPAPVFFPGMTLWPSAAPPLSADAPAAADGAPSDPATDDYCEHGGLAGTNATGLPLCPACRQNRNPFRVVA